MSEGLDRIFASKAAMRGRLAALPIEQKLVMLNELRARELALRASAAALRGAPEGAATPASGAEVVDSPTTHRG